MALNPTQLATLKTNMASGPLAAQVAPLLAASNFAGVARLYNAPNGPQAGPVPVPFVTKQAFFSAFAPSLASLPGLSAALQAKWDRVMSYLGRFDTVPINSTFVQNLIAASVTDAVLTAPQAQVVTALRAQKGSYAQVLFGFDIVLSAFDVQKASLLP